MKYSEFVKNIEDANCAIKISENDSTISLSGKKHDGTVAHAEVNKKFFANCYIDGISEDIAKLVLKLAFTPLKERIEKEKYFIHLFPGVGGYLNIGNDSSLCLNTRIQTSGYKTIFTVDEINDLAEKYQNSGLVKFDDNSLMFEKVYE